MIGGPKPQVSNATKKEPSKKAPTKPKAARRLTQKEQNIAIVDGIFEFLFSDSTSAQALFPASDSWSKLTFKANVECATGRKALVTIESSTRPKYAMDVDGHCKSGDRGLSGAGEDAQSGEWRVYLFSGPNGFYVYYDEYVGELIITPSTYAAFMRRRRTIDNDIDGIRNAYTKLDSPKESQRSQRFF